MKTPDLFTLNQLSNGVTIGNGVYYVAWSPSRGVATIVVAPIEGGVPDVPLEKLLLHTVDDNGEPLTFSSELEAHAFLKGLKKEKE